MKHDYKKDERAFYAVAAAPSMITLPTWRFIMIDGRGDPNGEDFAQRVGVLFPTAYAIKMRHKALCRDNPEQAGAFPCDDYAVYPLEGLWTSETKDASDKSKFIYTIMIRQPDFVTQAMFQAALEGVMQKKPHPLLAQVRFGEITEGLCVQALHTGPFDDEPATFARMDAFATAQGYAHTAHAHREIYLNDPRKTAPERRKTILRYQV